MKDNCMNIIQYISFITIKMNNSKGIKKFKYRLSLNNLYKELRTQDIYRVSDSMVLFLAAIGNNDALKDVTAHGTTGISFSVNGSKLSYYPRDSRFTIIDEDGYSYTMMKNTESPEFINKKWQSLESKIYDLYIETITYVSKEVLS